MAGKHNTDPLDFLYEELPPDKMAEARAHLAHCEECRDETAAIRQLVKTYRDADQPAPPPGLAEKVAAQAMAAAATPVAAAAPPEPEQEEPVRDPEFDRLKEEILAESRPGWRAWLFHPAWTVAASVLFICTVLIYISPRRDAMFNPPLPESRPAPAFAPAAAPRQRESLPALPRPTLRAKTYSTEAQPVPPLLREAEVLEQQPLPASAPPPPAPAAAPSAGALPREQSEQGSVPAPPRAPAVPQPHLATPTLESEEPAAASAPVFYGGSDAYAPEPSLPEASAMPDMLLPAAPSPAMPDQAPAEESAQRDTLSGEALARDIVDRGFHDAPAVPLPSPVADSAAAESATPAPARAERAPVIIDMVGEFEPPQLIERPTPIDTVKLARDLTFLAGMQIGNNELSDAWITVGMLRKYDPEKVNELTHVLRELEAQQEAADAALEKRPEQDIPAEPAELEEPQSDPIEPSAIDSEPEPIAPSETQVDASADESAEEPFAPESPPESDPVEKIVDETGGLSTETDTAPKTEFSSQEPEFAPAPVIESEPVVIVTEPIEEPVRISPADTVAVEKAVLPEPEPEPVQEAEMAEPPVIAPDVPKSSPDAFPPTLGEMQSARPAQPAPAPERNRFRWFQPREPGYSRFTTDPYWRRD